MLWKSSVSSKQLDKTKLLLYDIQYAARHGEFENLLT